MIQHPSYELLLRAVPPTALRILHVGCGEGNLAADLKLLQPSREVLGIERDPASAASAAARLDKVFTLDIALADPPIELSSIDCILYGGVLQHLTSPSDVLERYRRFLTRDGMILCSVRNAQHHSLVAALLNGNFQYGSDGQLDSAPMRLFTYSTLFKLVLDSGFAPVILDTICDPCPDGFLSAATPLLRHLGLNVERARRYLGVRQYIVSGTPLRYEEDDR